MDVNMGVFSCHKTFYGAAKHRVLLGSILLPCVFLCIVVPGRAVASFDDEPFLLRLSLALDRSSNYSDTTARQASIAFPGGSSDNPAAANWPFPRQASPSVSLTHIDAFSESGARVVATAGTVNVALPWNGDLSLAYARTDTIDQEANQGLSFDLSSNEFFITYRQPLSEDIAIGGGLRVMDGVIKETFTPVRPLVSEVDLIGADASFGVFAHHGPGWFSGAVAGVGWSGADIDIRIPGLGTTVDSSSDDNRFFTLRAGTGYVPTSAYGIYLEAQYLSAESNRAGSAEVGRLQAGFDLRATDSVVLRAGFGIDTEDEVTFSIGGGYQGFKQVTVDVAYQYNAAPEIRPEFGRFDLLTASLNVRF
jgi:hypothetical protein